MLVRGVKRIISSAVLLLVVTYISLHFYNEDITPLPSHVDNWIDNVKSKYGKEDKSTQIDHEFPMPPLQTPETPSQPSAEESVSPASESTTPDTKDKAAGPPVPAPSDAPSEPATLPSSPPNLSPLPEPQTDLPPGHYQLLSSLSSPHGTYFPISFGPSFPAINPNILPHPNLTDTYVLVAQYHNPDQKPLSNLFREITCHASFLPNGTLACTSPPAPLPIGVTIGNDALCTGGLAMLQANIGPHDARAFLGPSNHTRMSRAAAALTKAKTAASGAPDGNPDELIDVELPGHPYVLYGSNSVHTCFGMWIQDLRALAEWNLPVVPPIFKSGTELQRPEKWQPVEKNWFVFWDTDGGMYVHHDVSPQRVFARLEPDGSVGADLGELARGHDEKCMEKVMPKLKELEKGGWGHESESLHQATNSLAVTMCKRGECEPGPGNTFVFMVFQKKTFLNYKGTYEPYVMVFKQESPFELVGVGKKPFWVNGRGGKRERKEEMKESEYAGKGADDSQMVYITSMSWKRQDQTYNGFLDDVLFLAFGVDDKRPAGMDILTGDLFQNLGKCDDLNGP